MYIFNFLVLWPFFMTKQMLNPFKFETKAFRFHINPAVPAGTLLFHLTQHELDCSWTGPSKVHLYATCSMVKNSRHSPVKTGYPIIQQEQLIISSNGDETMVPCCSELPLYSIHASCCALFAHLPYLKGLKRQHGSAECALWWWVNETVIGGFITTIDSGMTDFSPVSVMGLIRSTSITCKVHYCPSLVKALIGAILRVTVIMLFLMYY